MIYEPKNFENLLGAKGFSDKSLKNHFALYQGYVKNTNKLIEILGRLSEENKTDSAEYSELRRRFGWEWNGMRLHEYYFWNIAKTSPPLDKNSVFFQKIVEDFGALLKWEKDFRAIGAMRGVGWIILCYEPQAKKLFNVWINEHDAGHLSGTIPLLVMDVFEHAYLTDYEIKRTDYIEAFFNAIDWAVVENRFNNAV